MQNRMNKINKQMTKWKIQAMSKADKEGTSNIFKKLLKMNYKEASIYRNQKPRANK